jgi:predicted DNA-binding transcriptional regulator YafY
MKKYKPQHARLLYIDREIGRGGYPNYSQLAQGYEVSVKTIQRDIDYMRYQLDAPLEYSARHRGYFYTEPNYKLPAISVKESDLFAIYLAEKLLAQYEGTPLYDSLRSVFRKIEESLPEKATVDLGKDHARFTVFPPSNTMILPGIWEKVAEAIRLSRRLRVVYRTPGSLPAPRELDPYHGVRYEGDWYVVGHCHLRNAIRTFSLARMEKVEMLGDDFRIPATFDFTRLTGSHFGVHWSDSEYQVSIRFRREVAGYIRERRWHPTQRTDEQSDGSLVLTLTVNHLLELKRWVLSWGEMARVQAPPELARDIAASAAGMAEIYREKEGKQ